MEYQISLAAARVNMNLTQEQAAPKLGVTARTLGNYEKGVTATPGPVLHRAAKVYGLPIGMLKIEVVDDGGFDAEKILDTNSVKPNYVEQTSIF